MKCLESIPCQNQHEAYLQRCLSTASSMPHPVWRAENRIRIDTSSVLRGKWRLLEKRFEKGG